MLRLYIISRLGYVMMRYSRYRCFQPWPGLLNGLCLPDQCLWLTLSSLHGPNVKKTYLSYPCKIRLWDHILLLFSADDIGLHRVENPSFSDKAVSLHLYSPPFKECASFDQRTGKKSMCKVTFWSEFGKRTRYTVSMRLIRYVLHGWRH